MANVPRAMTIIIMIITTMVERPILREWPRDLARGPRLRRPNKKLR